MSINEGFLLSLTYVWVVDSNQRPFKKYLKLSYVLA